MTIHRFLHNGENLIADATVTASSVAPAYNSVFPVSMDREGTGRAVVSAPTGYTGDDDATVDIRIASEAGGDAAFSDPVFSGVGNGIIENMEQTGAGLDPQDFTVTLVDTGTETTYASTDVLGVTISAVDAGETGNAIKISVSTSGLTFTESEISTLDAIPEDTKDLRGEIYDFGSYPLDANGNMNPETPRISFGDDPRIYRQYKTFSGGEWLYNFTPRISRAIPAGRKVYTVTGEYTVTIYDGVDTETYTATTIHDLLSSIRDSSSIVVVDGVVENDLSPDGMSVLDVSLRTSPYLLPISKSGSEYVTSITLADLKATAGNGALTEDMTIRCVDNSVVGRERWTVSGTVSGQRETRATTGYAYDDPDSGLDFTVPVKTPDTTDYAGIKAVVSYQTRATDEYIPPVCVHKLTLGAAATPKTITMEYRQKPTEVEGCECEHTTYNGAVSVTCLGLDTIPEYSEGGGLTDADYKSALEDLYQWKQEFIDANTAIANGTGDIERDEYTDAWTATLQTDRVDIELAEKIAAIFHNGLYQVVQGGGDVDAAKTEWDTHFAAMDSELSVLETLQGGDFWKTLNLDSPESAEYGTWEPGVDVTPTAYEAFVIPTTPNGWYYQAVGPIATTGTTGVSEPSWPEFAGALVDDNTVTWKCAGKTDPTVDLDAQYFDRLSDRLDVYCKKWEAAMARVMVAGGVEPPFSLASETESGSSAACWQDVEDASYYWVVNSHEYKPAFTNTVYHSCKGVVDQDTGEEEIYCTREFACVIKCECEEYLKEGDKVTITIDGALSSYQVGDSLSVPVVAAAPLYLSGGQTGTDTLTWTVEGSDYGVMPGIEMPSDDSAHYDSLGIEFDISHGVIPFAAGDAFTFSLEGATYQYRVDSGSWSSPESLPAISVAIADGLQISFEAGESPSWRELDEFAWTAKQPNAPDHVCSPDWQSWKPQTAPATLTVDIGTAQTLSAFAVWHSLPTGSTVTVSGSADNFSSTLWTKTLTASGEHLSVAVDSTLADCRYVRLTVSGVGKVKWWYAGDPSIPSVHANKVELENHYSTRGGRYMGRARGGEISWGEFLTSADVDNLLEMVEECKSSGNLPVCFIPHYLHLEQARMVRLSLDRISVSDVFHYQPDTDFEPNRFAMSLPLEGVL